MSTFRIVALASAVVFLCGRSATGEHAVFFPNSGPIPEGASATPGQGYGTALTVSCNTTSSSTTIRDVVLAMRLNVGKCGALRVTLTYTPQGGTPTSMVVIDRLGATGPAQQGDLSPMTGAYTFIDSTANIWTAATGATGANPVPAAVYNGESSGLTGIHTAQFFSTSFRGKPGNGTWSLRLDKNWITNTNDTLEAATITVIPNPPVCLGDLNNDNVINVGDLTIFLSRFGQSCP